MSTLFGILQTDINPHFSSYGPEGQGFESLTACQEKALNLNGFRAFSFSLAVWNSCFLTQDANLDANFSQFSLYFNPWASVERVDFLWQEYELGGKTGKSSHLSSQFLSEKMKMESTFGGTRHGRLRLMFPLREPCRWQKQELDDGKRKSTMSTPTSSK